jgi:hypothetical protein
MLSLRIGFLKDFYDQRLVHRLAPPHLFDDSLTLGGCHWTYKARCTFSCATGFTTKRSRVKCQFSTAFCSGNGKPIAQFLQSNFGGS